MPYHDVNIRLRHMLDHAREAKELAGNKSKKEIEKDRLLNLGLVRLFEIIGEAANRIPEKEQEKYPDIPWGQIIGLRNRLIHGYDAVDFDILWQIINQDLPSLILELEKFILPSG